MTTLFLTRLVIETTSPMAINSGGRDTGFDTQLARDANGLPMIPATTLAGVWRHTVQNTLGEAMAKQWFGSLEDSCSALTLSDATVNNSDNKNVTGLQTRQSLEKDLLLNLLLNDRPLHRERVSINDRGVAKDQGKFDQLLLPSGVRFTLDFKWDDSRAHLNIEQWPAILNCWQARTFALGASTRNGLGRIKIIASQSLTVNLAEGPSAGETLRQFRLNTHAPKTLDITFQKEKSSQPFATLPIKALDNWRCGSGTELVGNTPKNSEHSINILTYTEPRITWTNGHGKLSEHTRPVLCGSSIKGILAHRIAFHYRKHQGIWAEDMAECSHEEWQKRPIELKELLGHADDKDHNPDSLNMAGSLYVDDCDIQHTHTVIRYHNSIDRFTGGVRKGALYSEELLYQPEFTLKLWLSPHTHVSKELKAAIKDTLNDLKTGLLPMGAGSGRGTSLVMHNTPQAWMVNFDLLSTDNMSSPSQQDLTGERA